MILFLLKVFMALWAQAEQVPAALVGEAHLPGCQAADLAKWVQQALEGPGHLLRNPLQARASLEREWARVVPAPGEPLVHLGPATEPQTLVRVNLGAWKARGYGVDPLWEAMLRTAEGAQSQKEALSLLWQGVVVLAGRGLIPQDVQELVHLAPGLVTGGVVFRHSGTYHTHQNPAYRVVHPSFLPPGFLGGVKGPGAHREVVP